MSARTVTLYEPGYVIADKYELETLLGQGGMGAVWRARNVALDAQVAIKVVHATTDSAALRSRLLQEARASAKLAHPAIVKVFDVGQTGTGDPFIVMELLHGDSLGALLSIEGSLPSAQAVRILLPIVDALWLAHSKGLIHRDLKPDNVFIVRDDGAVQPKLVDFGIVKVQNSEGSSQLTQDGVVLGSPDYMSPEQARGQDDINHQTDVWSLCVVLYEVISGRAPFIGANYNALLRQIVEGTAPSLRELSVADDVLSGIVARGMSKQRDLRFGSMGELGRALATWLVSQGIHEDICGTTLETKWLRGTDPHDRPGRGSLVSINDAWPVESGSGIRPNGLLAAHTVPAPAEPAENPTSPRARPLWVAVAGAAFALALILAWYFSRSVEPRGQTAPSAAPPALTAAVVGVPEPASSEAPVDVRALPIEAPPGAADEKPALSGSGKVSSPAVRGSTKAPAKLPQRGVSAEPKANPRGDLISPY